MANVTPDKDIKALQAEVDRLNALLKDQGVELSAAQEAAKKSVDQQMASMQNEIREVATGDVVEVSRVKEYKADGYRDDGRQIVKPVFERVKLPTYFYKIDLPASGGASLVINGEHYYHGTTYTVDIDLLRTMKDLVARAWTHEDTINGRNENVFRRPHNQTLRGTRH